MTWFAGRRAESPASGSGATASDNRSWTLSGAKTPREQRPPQKNPEADGAVTHIRRAEPILREPDVNQITPVLSLSQNQDDPEDTDDV